jgi:uncharacterized protein (TIGR03083 family)
MSTLAARTIDALRNEHDTIASVVTTMTNDQLSGPSGASEWSVAQVLSHLGSGSEINFAGLRAGLGEADAPAEGFNESVWDRWNAMTPAEQRAGFLKANDALVAALEALTPEQHAAAQVPVGFLPAPLSVAGYAGLRLNEVAHHSWDIRVAVDNAAGLLDLSAAVLPDHMFGDLGFLLGFLGKADQVNERVVLTVSDSAISLVIDDAVSVATAADEATATFAGAPEAALRLVSGRLGPAYTPADVVVTGNVTLDELRAVFPGF